MQIGKPGGKRSVFLDIRTKILKNRRLLLTRNRKTDIM